MAIVNHPVVLGIDPGYDRLGWAVGNCNQQKKVLFQEYGCIQTNKGTTLFERFQEIMSQLTHIVSSYQPNELAIETIFFSKNKTTAMRVAETRGLIITIALQHGLSISEYEPSEIKSAVTGHGSATKQAVAKMVALQSGVNLQKELDDTVDAMAIVIAHLASRTIRGISK